MQCEQPGCDRPIRTGRRHWCHYHSHAVQRERTKRTLYPGEQGKARTRELAAARRARLREEGTLREKDLRHRYGITAADYDELLADQGGGCALCGRPPATRRLSVDHDHVTGKVRGLLCLPCNGALHYLERPAWHEAAAAYLKEHSSVPESPRSPLLS